MDGPARLPIGDGVVPATGCRAALLQCRGLRVAFLAQCCECTCIGAVGQEHAERLVSPQQLRAQAGAPPKAASCGLEPVTRQLGSGILQTRETTDEIIRLRIAAVTAVHVQAHTVLTISRPP